jgi:hypothetical protein
MAVLILQKFATGMAMSCGFCLAALAFLAGTVATMNAESHLVRYLRRWAYS